MNINQNYNHCLTLKHQIEYFIIVFKQNCLEMYGIDQWFSTQGPWPKAGPQLTSKDLRMTNNLILDKMSLEIHFQRTKNKIFCLISPFLF